MNLRRKGNWYEALAAQYLHARGYAILARQYRCPYGEIDLIARDGEVIVFIEVKGGQSTRFGMPRETVDKRKQRRIWRSAQHFLWSYGQAEASCRFDVVEILSTAPDRHKIEHIIRAFEGWAL